MCGCDGDGPSAFWETTRKARKRHKCSECRGWIEIGEAYAYIRGIWDGEASSFKQCSDCVALIAWALARNDCICFNYGQAHGDLIDDAYESGDAGYPAEIDGRIKAIRAKRRDPVLAAVEPQSVTP